MKYSLVFFFCFYARIASSAFCYWNTACSYKYFSSVTPYNAVRGDIRDSAIKIKECEPISIWGMFRHGKNYPAIKTASNMKEAIAIRELIISSYEKGRCSLCAQDIDNLRDWTVDDDMFEETSFLQNDGYEDMYGIGYRLKQVYPQLLNKLEHENYMFRPTKNRWVKDSAKAFVKGLGYGKELIDDDAIAEFDFMDSLSSHDKDDLISTAEANQYLASSDFQAAKDRIQRRLGLDYNLTGDQITALYNLCRFSWSGLYGQSSPWCALFTTEDLKVLEYAEDLEHYYNYGYGRSDANKFGQMPLGDLLSSFKKAKDGEGKKITAYFTGAEMLEMIYTALGWFRDSQPLTATQKNRDRIWRTSKISASAANLFMVLNRCTNENSSDYHIMFYMNEEPLRSVCEGGICSWGEFENKLSQFVNTTLLKF